MRDSRRTRLVLSLLIVIALTLITLDFRSGASSPLAALRDLGTTVFGPIERGAAGVAGPVRNTVQDLVNAQGTQAENEALRRENARLRAQLRSSQLTRERAAEFDDLLNLAGRGRYRIVPAEIVAVRGARGFEHTATIDAGSRDGLEKNMTVISSQGLVGRVVHVGTSTSTVLLAIDGSSHVGARLADSSEIGIVNGQGSGQMTMKLLDSDAAVQSGRQLVTFGSQGGSPYVPGVPIGTVSGTQLDSAELTLTADVDPFVDFSSLDLVGVVVQPPDDNPRDALLPPKPTSSADGRPTTGRRDRDPGGGGSPAPGSGE